MAINFPSSPTNGQTYTVNDITYVYDTSVSAWIIRADQVSFTSVNVTTDIITTATMNVVPAISGAFNKANTANITADLAFNHANAAFFKANTAVTDFSPAFLQANLAYAKANTANITADLAFNHANAAFLKANTSANTFVQLTDVPSAYAGFENYLVAVNSGGTGLEFTSNIGLDELVHTAQVAPTSVANDSVTVYVTATGTTPNREVAYKIKNEFGEEVIISSILT